MPIWQSALILQPKPPQHDRDRDSHATRHRGSAGIIVSDDLGHVLGFDALGMALGWTTVSGLRGIGDRSYRTHR